MNFLQHNREAMSPTLVHEQHDPHLLLGMRITARCLGAKLQRTLDDASLFQYVIGAVPA